MSAYGLTIKQEKFCERYLEHRNATRAYKEAGYSVKGWKDNAIGVAAHRVLKNTKVQLRINEVRQVAANRVEYTQEEALKRALEDQEMARELGQIGAAVSANRLASELSGYIKKNGDINIQINTWSEILDVVAANKRERSSDSDSVH